ncbi:Multifunctional-autoprocessing repeats-in-toxin [Achromobacter veterisilvae]|uniref:Multifunctional-autoprocessing repeats-in-toxin n=1 Tax=Achromobacter veterisilvae TaxID=2069367 RepID=A0A446C398_9BURK|nr:DNA-binding protein [Achromobacter veterisilvae]SSW62270.1 Multifunctional-autoprocessing repeats-in-toxin [Achromobacter veterisilvae]
MATGITETDVWSAADALLLEGARPTIERVRQKIGRGSPNTVSPYLETWFRSLGARIKDPGAFAASPAIPDPIARAAAHFWEAALSEARAEQARTYRERWEELAREGERLAADAEQLQRREAGLAQRERDLQETLKVAASQLAAAEDRLQAAELQLRQRDAQLEQHGVQLADARAAAQALLADAEKARGRQAQALEALEARHAAHERRWLNELDGERGAVKRLQARLDEAQAAGQQQLAQARKALAEEQELRRQAEQGAQALRAEAQENRIRHESDLAAAQGGAAAAREREHALETRLAAAEARAADFLEQLKSKDGQLGEMARHLMALAAGDAAKGAQADTAQP